MRDKILRFLRSNTRPGDRIAVAVSGGKDSMALLSCAASLAPALGLTVSAVHFHHGIRGAEADGDAEFLQLWCREHGIPFSAGRGDAVKYSEEKSMGLEEAARNLRYAYFSSLDADWVLTAHTAEDNLETMLLHLLRGSGLHGLTGIPPVRGRILRPMLTVTRQEVSSYLLTEGIPHREDATNALDNNPRNRLRHHVLPHLIQENPSLPEAAAGLMETLREEDSYLTEKAAEAFHQLFENGRLEIRGLLMLHPALQARVLERFLEPVPAAGRVHIRAALQLSSSPSPSGELSLPGGFRLRRVYGYLELCAAQSPDIPAAVSLYPGTCVSFGPFRVSCHRALRPEKLPACTFALRASAVQMPLLLRARQPGDTIRLSVGTKKVSRLMADEKIPLSRRAVLPLAEDRGAVVAVLPLRVSSDAASVPGEDCYLLTVSEMEEEK